MKRLMTSEVGTERGMLGERRQLGLRQYETYQRDQRDTDCEQLASATLELDPSLRGFGESSAIVQRLIAQNQR